MEYIITFIVGISVGSFLNVCIYRIPKGESVIYPSSNCDNCNNPLKPRDLIPIVGYLLLKGTCEKCQTKISVKYPLVELLTGIMFCFILFKYGFNLRGIFYCIFTASLIVVTFIDIENLLIPNCVVLTIILIGLGFHIFVNPFSFKNSILTFFGTGLFFVLLQIFSSGAIGGGDVKFVAALGLWLGWPDTTLAIFIGSLIGCMYGISIIVFKGKNRKEPIPYGPFLTLGSVIVLFTGERIWQWYLELII